MSVGDITSNKKGSGARFNDEKTDYSFMFLNNLPTLDKAYGSLEKAIMAIGMFQKKGEMDSLMLADAYVKDFARESINNEKYYLDPVIRVWEKGAEKYDKWNWAKGMNWSVPIACIARHYLDITERDQEIDSESGEPHWAHILCNIQMLLLFYETYPEGNDLPYTFIENGL